MYCSKYTDRSLIVIAYKSDSTPFKIRDKFVLPTLWSTLLLPARLLDWDRLRILLYYVHLLMIREDRSLSFTLSRA